LNGLGEPDCKQLVLTVELKSAVNYFHFLNGLSLLSFYCRNGLSKQMKQVSFVDGLSDDAQVSREERSFRLWINSLGISTYINNVFEDLRNG
jgi:hypothetical protein